MDAYYLKDYFHGYIKKLKGIFKIKSIIIMLAGGVVMSIVLALLLGCLAAFIDIPGPLTVSVLSLTLILAIPMLIFDRESFIYGLFDRALYLFKNRIHYSGYIVIAALTLISLVLCILGCPAFVLSAGLLFVLVPSAVSVISSAAFNSASRALDLDWRIGSDQLDILLFGAGAASIIISLVTILISAIIGGLR